MSNKKELKKMTLAESKAQGVVSLADRPNEASRYGDGGLSAAKLKERFDNLPNLIREKFNEVANALSGDEATKYVTLDANSALGETLYDFLLLFGARGSGISDKNISDYIQTLYQSENESESNSQTLKNIVSDMTSRIVDANRKISEIGAGETSPTITLTSIVGGTRVTITDKNGTKHFDILNGKDGNATLANYKILTSINDQGANADYKLTISLADDNNNVVSSSEVNLPLESLVMDGEVQGENLVLTLKNGNTINMSIGALVENLVTESEVQSMINDAIYTTLNTEV